MKAVKSARLPRCTPEFPSALHAIEYTNSTFVNVDGFPAVHPAARGTSMPDDEGGNLIPQRGCVTGDDNQSPATTARRCKQPISTAITESTAANGCCIAE
jgi:hypothetical protein